MDSCKVDKGPTHSNDIRKYIFRTTLIYKSIKELVYGSSLDDPGKNFYV